MIAIVTKDRTEDGYFGLSVNNAAVYMTQPKMRVSPLRNR